MTAAASRPARGRAATAPAPRGWLRQVIRRRTTIAVFCVLVAVACVTLLPFYWMLSSSLRTMENMFSIPIQWIPDPLNWRSYALAWQAQDFTRYFLNSGFVAVAITLSNLLLCSLAGYSLTMFHYRGRGAMFILILSTMMLPL
jgi:multiple sugar transport system permease protein